MPLARRVRRARWNERQEGVKDTRQSDSQRKPAPRKFGLPRARSTAFALLLLFLGFVAFALTAVASRLNLEEVMRHSAERDDAMETQLLIEQIHALLLDVEVGQRAFLITGREELLDPYRLALLKLQGVHARLSAQLAAASGQTKSTDELDALIAQRIWQANQNLNRRGGPQADVAQYVEGKRLMEAIRGHLDRLKAEQARRVESRSQAMTAVQRRTAFFGIALPLLGALLIAAAVGRLRYERGRRGQAETALRRMNATLEEQVGQHTQELQEALQEIQSFASELDRSIEAERRSLARELHDQFGQIATAIRMIVLGLRKTQPPTDATTVNELVELVDEAIGMARRISAALRPPLLDDLGLAAAVEHFASGIERQSGLTVKCDISDDSVLTASQTNQLFRILQEATTNVLRHARASELNVSATLDDGVYKLDISDNGVGPGSVRADASGIRNMKERAQLIDAVLHFGPGATKGTRVSVHAPEGMARGDDRRSPNPRGRRGQVPEEPARRGRPRPLAARRLRHRKRLAHVAHRQGSAHPGAEPERRIHLRLAIAANGRVGLSPQGPRQRRTHHRRGTAARGATTLTCPLPAIPA